MERLARLFREVEDPSTWRNLAPWLTIEDGLAWDGRSEPRSHETGLEIRRALVAEGYLQAPAFVPDEEARSLARAVSAIRARGLHPAFLYLYDQPWRMLGRVVPFFRSALHYDLEAIADVWAWHIDPCVDAGGWAPHRGWYEDVRGEDGLPSLVNVWVSLTRATERNACMHLVPLSRDPDWPQALARRPFDTGAGQPLPSETGSLLAWSANVLHWGRLVRSVLLRPAN